MREIPIVKLPAQRQHVVGNSGRYGVNTSKAKDLKRDQLLLVKDEYVRMSLRLQQAFGLRREEALKIQPRWADRGDHLQLKASWTKGGRERTVPNRTQEQAKRLAGLGSLIPG